VGSGGGIAVNNNFNLAGIYWGNFSEVIKGVNYLYPSFETLSWNEHNILDDFLNNGLGVKEPKYFHFQIEDEIKWILPLIISIGMILGITSVLLLCYDWRKKKIKVYRRHRKNHSKDKGYIETGESENNDEGDCASLK
ncbi:MAG: hypothetical protein LBC44_02305, partial [Mycoplasmataceae bacterium]|nr:hypothetical protein [Mycoplasmataceae bacterium]